MQHYEIIKVEDDGKLEIPDDFAHELGLVEGSYFLIGVDPDLKEANIERIALPGKDLVELELVVKDDPGVLSRISGILGKFNVNILFSESEGIEEVNLAAFVTIVDISNSSLSAEELKEEILKDETVEEVVLKALQ